MMRLHPYRIEDLIDSCGRPITTGKYDVMNAYKCNMNLDNFVINRGL